MTGAGRPAAPDRGAAEPGFTRRTVLLIVGLCVFAAGCAVVILVR
jgi:hypothetical protein